MLVGNSQWALIYGVFSDSSWCVEAYIFSPLLILHTLTVRYWGVHVWLLTAPMGILGRGHCLVSILPGVGQLHSCLLTVLMDGMVEAGRGGGGGDTVSC